MGEILIYVVAGALASLYLDLNFVELGLVLLLGLALLRLRGGFRLCAAAEAAFTRLAHRRALCIGLAGVLPILVRLALLPWIPVPQPWISDEFSHLLIADTFVHGRLANPTHPLWTHFESIHIFHQPTYASTYFPAIGSFLAAGQILGHPWIGVLLTSGIMCATLLWALYGIFPAQWALLGGAIAVLRWGVISYWTNSYWGGALGATGGALAFGAYVRLRKGSPRLRDSVWLGTGFALLAITRPLEGLVFSVPIAIALLIEVRPWRRVPNIIAPAAAILALAAIGLGYYCKAVTHDAFRIPYRVNQAQYGWPMTLPWEKPKPVSFRNREMRLYYDWEVKQHEDKLWPGPAIQNSTYHLGPLWRFYFGPALTIPLLLGWRMWRDRRTRLAFLSVLTMGAAGFLLAAYPHYISPVSVCAVAVVVQAIRHCRATRDPAGSRWARAAVAACVLMLPIRAFIDSTKLPNTHPGDHIFSCCGYPEGRRRAQIAARLDSGPDRHVVFVRYHRAEFLTSEWVYNGADIDGQKIVWARDMGPEQNLAVMKYYRGRKFWLVNVDDAAGELVPITEPNSTPVPAQRTAAPSIRRPATGT